MMCDQCHVVRINGIACHETGCPNWNLDPMTGKRQTQQCPWCGCAFTQTDEHDYGDYCDDTCRRADYGEALALVVLH